MKSLWLISGLLLGLSLTTYASQKSYKNYKVLRTQKLTVSQSHELKLLENEGHYDFWTAPSVGRSCHIMAEGIELNILEQFLQQHGIDYSTMVDDVQEIINKSKMSSVSELRLQGDMDWHHYYDHNALNLYIDELAKNYSWINTVSIGKSYEGRDMRVIQLSKAGPGKANVWIEAGIHAREWISPAMATYTINQLLSEHRLLDHLNIHILPSSNPDGYEFCKEDRMWRKTRSDLDGSECKGVDPNRNWGFHFGESGVSSNKCSDNYPGPEAFSEVETQNIRDYVLELEPTPILAMCLHSFSQLWMYPYGYAYDVYPENVEEIKKLGEQAVDALHEVHGTEFEPINSADLYPAAGAADDWYQGVLKARFAYTVELRDTGHYGFILPEDQIIPSGEELWAALQVVLTKMAELSQEE